MVDADYHDMLVDDVGSFPLPKEVNRDEFQEIYPEAQKAFANGVDLTLDPLLNERFCKVVESSFKLKIDSGLDIVSYPQHHDMHKQFLDPINQYQKDPFLIDEKYAVIPELFVAEKLAKRYYEEKGERLKVKVCVTGPIELHLRTEFGFYIYEEILNNLARSVNAFLKNSILNTKYVETPVMVIDEPSLGFADLLNIEKDGLIKALERSVKGIAPTVQIHLHALKVADIPLNTEGIDVLTGEFAASPQNIDMISKKDLETHDKFIRGGITRTNLDFIIGEQIERGMKPGTTGQKDLVDSEDVIKKRYEKIYEKFSNRLRYVGPDCGLGSWPSQEVAFLLLKRSVNAIE